MVKVLLYFRLCLGFFFLGLLQEIILSNLGLVFRPRVILARGIASGIGLCSHQLAHHSFTVENPEVLVALSHLHVHANILDLTLHSLCTDSHGVLPRAVVPRYPVEIAGLGKIHVASLLSFRGRAHRLIRCNHHAFCVGFLGSGDKR